MDVSFGTVWEAIAAQLPDAVALSEPEHDYAYAEFEDRAARLARVFNTAGVRPGDAVGCYLHNGAAYLEAAFAALKIGAVPVNVNYRYTHHEVSAVLEDAEVVALVFSGEWAGTVASASENASTVRLLVQVGHVGAGGVAGAAVLEELLAATSRRPAAPRPGSDPIIVYTGGTTGAPKGVVWRQTDLLQCLRVPIFRPLGIGALPASRDEVVDAAVTARRADRAPVTMPVVPLMHATGLFNAMGTLLVGGRIVTAGRGALNARQVWNTVTAQRVGTLLVAGNAVCQPLVEELLAAERCGGQHELRSLTSVLSSGMALSDQLKHALHDRMELTIVDAIAASETGPLAFAVTTSCNDLPARFFPGAATRVLSDNDEDVASGTGQVGRLACSGPMPVGYYNDPA